MGLVGCQETLTLQVITVPTFLIREFDDFAAKGDKNEDELKKKADEVVKRFSLIDMADMARKTSLGGNIQDPASVMNQATKLQADYAAKRITEQEYKKRMTELNAARQSAERANVQ